MFPLLIKRLCWSNKVSPFFRPPSPLQSAHSRTDGPGRGVGGSVVRQPVVGRPGSRRHCYPGQRRLLYHTSPGLQAGQLHREGTSHCGLCGTGLVQLSWTDITGHCLQRFPPGLITANHPNVSQLQLFTFNKKEEVQKFILEHIQCVSRSRNKYLKSSADWMTLNRIDVTDTQHASDHDFRLSSKRRAVMESSCSSTASSVPAPSTGNKTKTQT